MKQDLCALLRGNPYPGRGIVLGRTADGKSSVAVYFIMGRSANSRNRIFAEEPDGIRTQAAAERIGKPVGQYLTASFSNLLHDAAQNTALAELLGEHLKRLLPEKGGVLVLGLGNPSITPDAVGPRAVEGVMATRHIGPALEKAMGISFRPVSALAPGVLGQTGSRCRRSPAPWCGTPPRRPWW